VEHVIRDYCMIQRANNTADPMTNIGQIFKSTSDDMPFECLISH